MPLRTYIYKMTSDRGGAPCAPDLRGHRELLTLSICKPAIRRTAQAGDRLLGITSRALVASEGYPPDAVIYAAVVERAIDARVYYRRGSGFGRRPDCIYTVDAESGTLTHTGRTQLHADPAYLARDLGSAPYYRNGRTLLCREFRYFGAEAPQIPHQMEHLLALSQALGQGHRVEHTDAVQRELDALFKMLWKLPTRHTPARVEEEARGHGPGPRRQADRLPADRTKAICVAATR